MPDTPLPVHLEKTDDRCLLIRWDDGLEQKIPFRMLRDGCQCASCNAKREQGATQDKPPAQAASLPILSAAEARPLDIEQMRPVGNYAYNIQFSDGHSSGIFTFELLRSLG